MPESVSPLAAVLRDEIARLGPIPFRDFMARALYDPHHGYYGSGRAKIGRGGDFFTNVSVGPLFGRLLTRQFVEMWERLGRPTSFAIVEQGAHQGNFAADVLAALREFAPDCFAATTYWIVEPSLAMQAVQNQTIAAFSANDTRVCWVDSLENLPSFIGVHFSNELPDAFPVHRVAKRANGWCERAVTVDGDGFAFIDAPLSNNALTIALSKLPAVAEGYETEINLHIPAWIADVASRLLQGFVLAIDYGYARADYYRPERANGTLSAYADHQREDNPLARPGKIDLTAHVDFTSLAEAALAAGLHLTGFTDQHHFMVGLGQLHFSGDNASPQEIRAFKTLMHPNLMGRSFHAFCVARDVSDCRLSGFQFARDPAALFLPS